VCRPVPLPPQLNLPEAVRIGTCYACRRPSRKLYRPRWYAETSESLASSLRYSAVCTTCWPRITRYDDVREIQAEQPRKSPGSYAKRAYPCIGGPLDGEHVITADFRQGYPHDNPQFHLDPGVYYHLADQYRAYNSSSASRRAGPSLIYVHESLLQDAISPRRR
jgi:hypothetical protein